VTIYWRVKDVVFGVFLLIQTALWAAYTSPTDTEAIQDTGQELLRLHLHQHLSAYSKFVNEEPHLHYYHSKLNHHLGTFPMSTLTTVIDSATISKLP